MVDVPEAVDCPCGTGKAERLSESTSEPGPLNRRRVIHSYRHTGCPVGGQIIVEGQYVLRRTGPLFWPARYGVEAVATDGGEVVDE